jgi:toxin secretion/phage lysis holin
MTTAKMFFTTSLTAAFLALGLSKVAVLIFGALMMIDFVTGVAAAYIIDEEVVTSDKALQGIIRKVSVFLLPFVVALVGKGAGYSQMQGMITAIVSLLITTEGYSIIGNIYCIHTKKRLPEIDAVELLLDKLAKLLKNLLG